MLRATAAATGAGAGTETSGLLTATAGAAGAAGCGVRTLDRVALRAGAATSESPRLETCAVAAAFGARGALFAAAAGAADWGAFRALRVEVDFEAVAVSAAPVSGLSA